VQTESVESLKGRRMESVNSGAVKIVLDPLQDDTTAASTNFYCYV